ncbi:MAG: hypothetical protein GTN70_11005 [Deltaproteobacteria bacterium]|nr:hypothetical protein [Deltaproteobacteria bacterium]NIS78301.1 hypothetical protein [Deltaproteobacteria bacterium]
MKSSVCCWIAENAPGAKYTTRIIFFILISFFTMCLFPVPESLSSPIASEQRERVGEIDRELVKLQNGKKSGRSKKGTEVKGIRHYTNSEYARVVFDLSSIPEYSVDGNDEAGNVFRVILKNTDLLVSSEDCEIEPDRGLLKCLTARRVGSGIYVNIFSKDRSRIEVFKLASPPRMVVDLFRNPGGSSSALPPAASLPGGDVSGKRKVVVVIDPGHGGKDPGAIGPGGLKEKDVVLDISRKLKKLFEKDGRFKVHLTRSRDNFLSLEKRTAIANRSRADIFISVHTNASRKRAARGISSFVLGRKATDKEALELAMKENGVVIGEDSKVNYIVMDLMNDRKEKESLKLAKVINDSIVQKVRSRRRGVVNLGVKKAPFYVLFGAGMPAVLVETSFITNKSEEKFLRKRWYRDYIAASIYRGITQYIDRSKTAFYGLSGQ